MRRLLIFFFYSFSFLVLLIVPTAALAAGSATYTINPNLPGTYPINSIPGIIENLYSFALAIAGILALGAIVYGGVRYATGRGNPSSESEGKSWITSALLGLLLLAGAYIILQTINPQLVSLQIPSLPTLKGAWIPGVGVTQTPPTVQGGTCSVITSSGNPCSVSSVQSACSAWDPNLASQVCNKESGGGTNPDILSATDKCEDGTSFSIGVWQINAISTPGMPSSCSFNVNKSPSGQTRVGCGNHYSGTFPQGVCLQCNTNSSGQVYCAKWSCSFNGNSTQYGNCVAGVAAVNNKAACTLYEKSGNFCPWAVSAYACNISVPCSP